MTAPRPRLAALDLCRGMALLAMALFHSVWDLVYFGWLPSEVTTSARFHGFGHSIASVFFALAGVSLILAHKDQLHWQPFLRRLALLTSAAGAISVITWYGMPEGVITFGMLHCLAIGSLLAVMFIHAPVLLTACAALLALAAPLFIAAPLLNGRFVQWLGLGTFEPATYDWRPLFPWLGVILGGMLMGRWLSSAQGQNLMRALSAMIVPRALRGIAFLGRHGLAFYLIHQPIIFGAMFVITQMMVPIPSSDERAYMTACRQQCENARHDVAFCARMCGCVADGLKTSGLWDQGLSGAFTPRQHQEMEQIAHQCARAE